MHVDIDEKLLNALTTKTGQSKEVLLAQASKLIENHFQRFLEEGSAIVDLDTDLVMAVAESVMDDFSEAFHELAH